MQQLFWQFACLRWSVGVDYDVYCCDITNDVSAVFDGSV